jgi:beta-glucosidase
MEGASGPFLIGVATSGYQSEGGYNQPGQPANNWAACERSGRVATTGAAVDFWNRYEDDYRLARGIGLNAFRLSVEWSRVQPSDSLDERRAPDWDLEAIDGYAVRIAACRREGLEPVVTLQHFTHPAWLGTDAWLDDRTPAAFEEFVRVAVGRINDQLADVHGQPPLRWYVTLNEPNMLVLNTYLNRHFPGGGSAGIPVGLRAYNRLLAAHLRAYNAIHDLHEGRGWAVPMVTMNTFCSDVYWSDMMLLDALDLRERGIATREAGGFFEERSGALSRHFTRLALGRRTDLAALAGAGLHRLANHLASKAATPDGFDYFFKEVERAPRTRALDYLGVDYYDPFLSHALRLPDFSDLEFRSTNIPAHVFDVLSSKWWDWHFLPEGLSAFCSHYASAFPGRGILIAENGMAQRCSVDNRSSGPRRDGLLRSDHLAAHLGQVQGLIRDGVPLLGYLHWSLTDNYEWGSFTPRFGLYRINFQQGLERLAVDHLGDNPSATYARIIRRDGFNKLTINWKDGIPSVA